MTDAEGYLDDLLRDTMWTKSQFPYIVYSTSCWISLKRKH